VYDNTTGSAVNTPKSYGKSIKVRQLGEGVAKFFPVGDSSTSSGLPKKILVPILQGIREEVQEIRNIFAKLEVRMVGGSLLVIYEADWQKAEEKLNQEEDEDEDEGDSDDDEDENKTGPPFMVRVIDFAHTTLEPGQGVDSGVLLGLNTVLRLLDERLSEIN
jgi:1D-myo-inositol-tetrakisphosphate 5-kinase/inositol-polyphosphate multikinase